MSESSGHTETPSSDRRNAFDRIFPGPAPRDPHVAARLQAIERAAERRADAYARKQSGNPPARPQRDAGGAAAPAPAAATSDDIGTLLEALREQTDVVRSLLDADIAIRDDARATAQNTRTFAIAGTAIALLTLIATVVTVVLAFKG